MLPINNFDFDKYALNRLTFSQEQAIFVLGHSLRSIYQDLFSEPVPEHLQALAARLEQKHLE
ncbi:hypothetical protein DC522_23955 [Microvirga sp. KLBC 81]|uniref:NepR family anti-sigma factor n=1 Tax=Microvirga sp. KLBC 81 TaxID=1862707 RepID=UPI000D524C57|nr:NepR family anti-sigma factor [Microvirga sp. KLBC 81]PVE21921.1 hypothetical protein DC522_23955 [Microvirga sp. KLBC 81]